MTAAADPVKLGSRTILQTGAAPMSPGDTNGRLTLSIGGFDLFATTLISTADIGRTLIEDGMTDADFASVASLMTNGRANFIGYLFGPPRGGGGGVDAASEAALFNLPAGMIDFAGSTITALTLTIRDFSSTPSMDHPGFTQLHLDGDLTVLGTPGATPTPEPSTLLLLGAGAAGLVRARRRLA
jgi:hypothetical protein